MTKDTMRLDRGQIEVMDETMAEVLRAKTPAERLRIGFGFWTSAQKMLQTHLATRHPDGRRTRIQGSRQEVITWSRMNCWRKS